MAIENIHHYYDLFLAWLHLHPQWGLAIAFIAAFCESIPVIGTFIPGIVTMTMIGVLVGARLLPLTPTIVIASAGAISADTIGYAIGYYYRERLKQIWPFRKHPSWLERGSQFVSRHGGKSVFFCRFIGIIRAMLPLIVGTLRMKPLNFYLADTPSAILWVIAYMLPGFLLGRLSLIIPTALATKLILTFILLLILLWFFSWMVRLLHRWLQNYYRTLNAYLWRKIQQPTLNWLHRHFHIRHQRQNSGQIGLILICFLLILLLLGLSLGVMSHNDYLTAINRSMFDLFRSLHTVFLMKAAIVITGLGEPMVILPMTVTLTLYFIYKRQWQKFWYWLALVFLVTASTFALKHLFFNPRPTGLLHGPTNSSFPSGHTTLAITLYGFIAYLFCQYRPRWRHCAYRIVVAIALLVVLSRLYLGVHWLTDIIGSILLALSCLLVVIIHYRRHPSAMTNPRALLLIPLFTLVVTMSYYLYQRYEQRLRNYQPVWSQQVIASKEWWQKPFSAQVIPLYRNDRLGQPKQVFNIQWAGQIRAIRAQLRRSGWSLSKTGHFVSLLRLSWNVNAVNYQAVITQLHQGQPPVIAATNLDKNNAVIVLYLWPSNVFLKKNHLPIWVGVISKKSDYRLFKKPKYASLNDIQTLLPAIQSLPHKLVTFPNKQLPAPISHKGQNYLVLIKSS